MNHGGGTRSQSARASRRRIRGGQVARVLLFQTEINPCLIPKLLPLGKLIRKSIL